MNDSEDKAGPQKHEKVPNSPQEQSLAEEAPAAQNHANSDKQATPHSQKKSKPPRKSWVESLISAGVTSQEIWNAAVAFFTGALLIITYWQYQLGQEQLRFTQMNERPWISAEIQLPHPFMFDEKGNLGVEMTLAIKNVGKTVAQESRAWAELVFLDPDGRDIAAQQRQIDVCKTFQNPTEPFKDGPGFTLFPDVEPLRLIMKTGKWAKEIAPELARALPANKGKVGFAIIGCVSYRAVSEDPSRWRHQTRFLYHIGLWDEETEETSTFMRPRGGPYTIALLPKTYGSGID